MTKDKLINEMADALDYADLDRFEALMFQYVGMAPSIDAAKSMAGLLVMKYASTFNADAVASIMSLVISNHQKLALIDFPQNPLYNSAIITGSPEVYDCFIQEALMPYFESSGKSPEEIRSEFNKLLHYTVQLNRAMTDRYTIKIKGMDYNGPFQEEEGYVMMNTDDYLVMEEMAETCNKILGRMEIIKDLMSRSGIEY